MIEGRPYHLARAVHEAWRSIFDADDPRAAVVDAVGLTKFVIEALDPWTYDLLAEKIGSAEEAAYSKNPYTDWDETFFGVEDIPLYTPVEVAQALLRISQRSGVPGESAFAAHFLQSQYPGTEGIEEVVTAFQERPAKMTPSRTRKSPQYAPGDTAIIHGRWT